jgi:hypothetical protein
LLTGANSPTMAASFTGTNQFNGYSTGTDVFADLLQSGPNPPLANTASRVLNANVGFSGSAVDSSGLKAITNEMNMGVVPNGGLAIPPNGPARNSYSRGSGLDAGIATPVPNNPDVNQIIIAGLAEQAATPQTPACTSPPQTCGPGGEIIKEVGPVPGDPLIYADLLRGESLSQFNPTACDPNDTPASTGGISDITKDLAFGLGRAAKVQLLDQGKPFPDGSMGEPTISLEAPPGGPPQDTVAQSKSFNFLTKNADGTAGLTSETIQSIAPVSLDLGGNILTIEIGGPWIMRATATGKGTGSEIHVGPADQASPTTLLITITPPGQPTQTILKTQDLFGGSNIPQHIFIPPGPANPHLAEISIGEDPRAIGDDNTDTPAAATVTPTNVSGALDVVRVKLLVQDPVTHVSDIRVGHIEASAQVPSGGIDCGGGGTTTTGNGGSTTTTSANGGTTTTTAGNQNGGTTTTTAGNQNGGTTTTTAANQANGTTTTTAANQGGNGSTTSTEPPATTTTASSNNTTAGTAPPQVQAVTFSQTPTANPQTQTPNFTG